MGRFYNNRWLFRNVVLCVYLTLLAGNLVSCQIKEAANAQTGLIDQANTEQVNLIFEHTRQFPDSTQISFAFINRGETQYYGIKCLRDTFISIENRDSVFEIGSISKVFTATILGHFVEEGLVTLDQPIQTLIKKPLHTDQIITLKQLSNHTSGLPRLPGNLILLTADPQNPYKNYDENKLLTYLIDKLELSRSPGEQYEYSNLGAGLLGYLLSKMSNHSYEDLLKKYIFDPLKMEHSTTLKNKILDRLVYGRDNSGKVVSNWDLNVLAGAGGIVSSTNDLVKFARAQFDPNNKALALTRRATHAIDENMDIALGWHIIKNKDGHSWVWHNGGTGGYRSSMAIDPDNQDAVIILSNVSAFHPDSGKIDQLCFALMKTMK